MAKTFQELIQSDEPVLVDFMADWCGPCKTMAPILQDLKASMGDRLTIIKIDVDKNPEAAQQFQVRGIPTLLLFRKGKMIWRQSGAIGKVQLEQAVQQHLAGA
jgi:thioredoxin 1